MAESYVNIIGNEKNKTLTNSPHTKKRDIRLFSKNLIAFTIIFLLLKIITYTIPAIKNEDKAIKPIAKKPCQSKCISPSISVRIIKGSFPIDSIIKT